MRACVRAYVCACLRERARIAHASLVQVNIYVHTTPLRVCSSYFLNLYYLSKHLHRAPSHQRVATLGGISKATSLE